MRLLLCKDTDYILKIERGGAKVRRIIYGNRSIEKISWVSLKIFMFGVAFVSYCQNDNPEG